MMNNGDRPKPKSLPIFLASILVLGATACSNARLLMPTPASYAQSPEQEIATRTAERFRSTDIELLYFTDRAVDGEATSLAYGAERSRSLAFGTAKVRLGNELDWETVATQSDLPERDEKVELILGQTNELARFPAEPYQLVRVGDTFRRGPESLALHEDARDRIHQTLAERLARSPTKRVFLYVHGFNESFASAAFTLAELCHFLERRDVCVLFTWPASQGGLFSYTETTETAEYAAGHLRKVIRTLAASSEVESINLLAHSRGTALSLSALRELGVTAVAYGAEPAELLKINHIVLAAPDIDADVAVKKFELLVSEPDAPIRWTGDLMPQIIRGRFTTYVSPQDRALSMSSKIFRGKARVGLINPELAKETMTAEDMELFRNLGMVDVMVLDGKRSDLFGHGYFTGNPAVSADLIALLRDDARPGQQGRPATQLAPHIWALADPARAQPAGSSYSE